MFNKQINSILQSEIKLYLIILKSPKNHFKTLIYQIIYKSRKIASSLLFEVQVFICRQCNHDSSNK